MSDESVDWKGMLASLVCIVWVVVFSMLGVYVSVLFYFLALLLFVLAMCVFIASATGGVEADERPRTQEKKEEKEISFLDVIWENIDSNLSELEEFLFGDTENE